MYLYLGDFLGLFNVIPTITESKDFSYMWKILLW